MPDSPHVSFAKSPPALVARFAEVLDRYPDAKRRQMFGYPAAFIGGNMVTSLHGERWVVRLSEDSRGELLALAGAGPFEPMPGRPMKGYATLPPSVVADDSELHAWVRRAIEFGQTLPPKR
ncbi:MAG TPA: TfoX/Sxy family protein [Candidatus Limnocylindrales bacterium]